MSDELEQAALEESKHLHTHRGFPARGRLVQVFHAFEPKAGAYQRAAQRRAGDALDALVARFEGQMHVLLRRYLKATPRGKPRAYEALATMMRRAYRDAYLLGLGTSGLGGRFTSARHLGASEERWLRSFWTHEQRYLKRLVHELDTGKKPLAKVAWRIRMYALTIGASYHAGQVLAMHPDTLLHWVVDPQAENCPDCLMLQSLSPFTKTTLPTTPRAGACRCLSNCKCAIRGERATPAQVREVARVNRRQAHRWVQLVV